MIYDEEQPHGAGAMALAQHGGADVPESRAGGAGVGGQHLVLEHGTVIVRGYV